MEPTSSQPVVQLLREHAHLEMHHEDGGAGNFISGWQCCNSLIASIDSAVNQERQALTGETYRYLEDDDLSKSRIKRFHYRVDGVEPEALLPGAGSTPILTAFCAYLRERDVTRLYYVPPLYFSMHATLSLFGIEAVSIVRSHGFEPSFDPVLPKKRCVLVMCDPVWYAGKHLPVSFIERLLDWQSETGSLIFVDGSFQYMNWDNSMHEPTSRLDPGSTIRLICPTKSLVAHGYRFAYAIVPAALRTRLAHIHIRMNGSCSIDSIAMARAAPQLLCSSEIRTVLIQGAAGNHHALRVQNSIESAWDPDCGYFVFEKATDPFFRNKLMMDGKYFEQYLYPGYTRINLLSPSIVDLIMQYPEQSPE
jgi:histidinol-phosphate/aromatic aminotransferase/cobyric acid decarboxylase-like protein